MKNNPDKVVDQEPITHLPENPPDENSYKKNTFLDLVSKPNGPNYQLYDIAPFNNEKYKKVYKHVQSLDGSDNFISGLKLKGYDSLVSLIAANNHISQVELNLQKLRILDLSKNNIKKMFELINLPNLREIKLSQNSISEVSYDQFKSVKTYLCKIDLSENGIEFPSSKEFFYFFETGGQYVKDITSLNFLNNPFTHKKIYKDTYTNFIKMCFNNIQILNGKDIIDKNDTTSGTKEQFKERVIEAEKKEGYSSAKVGNKKKRSEKITLPTINSNLLRINQLGRLNDKTGEELEELIDSYFDNGQNEIGGTTGSETKQDLQDQEGDDFEIFLDYIEKIIDCVSEFENRLYGIIGKFSTIKYGKFTSRALSCIKQRISNENINDIIQVLYYILQEIKKTNDLNVPVNGLNGGQCFGDEPKFTKPLQDIMKKIVEIGINIGKYTNYAQKSLIDNNINNDIIYLNLFESVTSFIARAMKCNNDLLMEFVKEGVFIGLCVDNTKRILIENDDDIIADQTTLNILVNILYIIRIICGLELQHDKSQSSVKKTDSITTIFGSGLRDKIEQKLSSLIQEVTKDQVGDSEKYLLQLLYRRKKECCTMMQCYGALLSNASDIGKYGDKQSLPIKIIEILSQNHFVDPIIIHGACDFTFYIGLNKVFTNNPGHGEKITNKLYNLRYLLPYGFPNRQEFIKICGIADKYGDHTCERGKPIDLRYMNSPIINDLFISITTGVSWFGKNSQKKLPISPICVDICKEMNTLQRDTALTSCLLVPNEDVKISVVECFFSVNVEELSPEELSSIYKQLSGISSITGKMQTIVSVIFIIMNKWFLHHLKHKNYENIETCKEAIFLALDLLSKNDGRKGAVDEEDEKKKCCLSAIGTVFLINVSNFKETKKYFSETKNVTQLSSIGISEQNSIDIVNIGFPIEIEKCHCGWYINNLIVPIKSGTLEPYNYVSLRVLIHIGDILMNRKFPLYDINYELKSGEIGMSITAEMKEREVERIKEQELNWRNLIEIEKRRKFDYCISLTPEELKVEQSNFVKNFSIFLEFMLGQRSDKQISELSQIWEGKFSNNISRIKYSAYDKPRDVEDKFTSLIDDDDDGNENETIGNNHYTTPTPTKNEDDDNLEETDIYERFKNYLRQEEYDLSNQVDKYSVNFDYMQGELGHTSHYGITTSTLSRKKEEETPNNPYIRSLFVSAFFRCIYAVGEYSEDKAIKERMIKILYQKDNIRTLCNGAECTKFVENNIATKFLGIIRHVLRNTKVYESQYNLAERNKRKDEITSEILTKFGNISFMICKIIKVFKKDLNIEKNEHKLLLSEVCQCAALVITQLQTIKFLNDNIQEATMTSMINFEVIKVFILMIKEYMNKEAEVKGKSVPSFGFNLLQEMVSINSTIIGEYMTNCPSRKYDILESFTCGYFFERVKMRKTIIKEIIDASNDSIVKKNLIRNMNEGNSIVTFIARTYGTNYNQKSSKLRLLAVTEQHLEFYYGDNEEDYKYETSFNKDSSIKILFEDINAIMIFQYKNRMLIQTKDNEYGFFFYKMTVSKNISDLIREFNNKVIIYENVEVFGSNDIRDFPGETPNDVTTSRGNEKVEDNDNKALIINCSTEIADFCNIFSNWFKKKEIVKDQKVVVIRENQVQIYKELLEKWETLRPREGFERAKEYKGLSSIRIVSFMDFFEYLNQYDIGEFESMKLIDADKLQLCYKKRSPTQKDQGPVFMIYDNMSYTQFKNGTGLVEQFENYDEI